MIIHFFFFFTFNYFKYVEKLIKTILFFFLPDRVFIIRFVWIVNMKISRFRQKKEGNEWEIVTEFSVL